MLCSLILIRWSVSDRFGKKKNFYLRNWPFYFFLRFFASISQSISQLVFSALYKELEEAMMVPGSLQYYNTSFEEKYRGYAIGIWSDLQGVGALAPLAGDGFVKTFDGHQFF